MLKFGKTELMEQYRAKFIDTGGDYILEFEELLDLAVDYFEDGGKDVKFLADSLGVKHNQILAGSEYYKDPYRTAHRHHYVKEAFCEAFGFNPN